MPQSGLIEKNGSQPISATISQSNHNISIEKDAKMREKDRDIIGKEVNAEKSNKR